MTIHPTERGIHYVHAANKAYEDGIVFSFSTVRRTAVRS